MPQDSQSDGTIRPFEAQTHEVVNAVDVVASRPSGAERHHALATDAIMPISKDRVIQVEAVVWSEEDDLQEDDCNSEVSGSSSMEVVVLGTFSETRIPSARDTETVGVAGASSCVELEGPLLSSTDLWQTARAGECVPKT